MIETFLKTKGARMRLKVWNEEEAKNAEEGQLFVKMESCPEHADIHIYAVDKKGKRIEQGNLIIFDLDLKCLIIADHVSDDVPLKTDIDGLLLFMSEDEYRERTKSALHHGFMSKILGQVREKECEQASKH